MGRKHEVLIVDGLAQSRELFSQILARRYGITTVESADEALVVRLKALIRDRTRDAAGR